MARRRAEERLHLALAMLPWVMERGEATVAEVASTFGLTEEEALEELTLLSCQEIPGGVIGTLGIWVDADVARVELSGIRFEPLSLTAAEGLGLRTAAQAALNLPGADPNGVLRSALAKLDDLLQSRASLDIDLGAPPLLAELQEAVANRSVVALSYYAASRDEVSVRDVEAQRVWYEGGHWYFRGFCRLAGDGRTFRVDRIEDAAATDERHERDVSEADAAVSFRDADELPVVTLRLPSHAVWVAENYPTVSVKQEADHLLIALGVSSLVFLERLLLQVGPGASIVDLDDDAAQLGIGPDLGAQVAARLLANYPPN